MTGILEVVPAVTAFIDMHLKKQSVPAFTWTISNSTGEIVATLNEHGIVHEVNVWWAVSCGNNAADGIKRRDFRIANIDSPCHCGNGAQGYCANLKSFWDKKVLEETTVRGHRTYSAKFDAPADGTYIAFFIEVTYDKYRSDVVPLTIPANKNLLKIGERIPPIPKDIHFRPMFTSEVSVWPNTFPYPDCHGSTCTDTLV